MMFKVGDVIPRLHNSPIRMRREIVGGTYGPVTVERELYTGKVLVHTDPIASAEELREAAHLFSQLAEVLEENK